MGGRSTPPVYAPTWARYAGLYTGHIAGPLGASPCASFTPELIGRWQADRGPGARRIINAQGADNSAAFFNGHSKPATPTNPASASSARRRRWARAGGAPARAGHRRSGSRARAARRRRPRQAIDAQRRPAIPPKRVAVMVSLLAYAGLRPQGPRFEIEHVHERTLTWFAHQDPGLRDRRAAVAVLLLAPLANDLRQWQLAVAAVRGPSAPGHPRSGRHRDDRGTHSTSGAVGGHRRGARRLPASATASV